jgi:hypothetical protein
MTAKKEKKTVGNKLMEVSEELKKVGLEVINKEGIDLMGAEIEYMTVHPHISKKVAGRCIRTSRELNFFSDADYIVQMSGELWDALDDKVRYILMWHELKHILPVTKKTGDVDYRLADHDVKDFYQIIKAHGVDWFQTIKTTISSLYDMEPSEEDGISL